MQSRLWRDERRLREMLFARYDRMLMRVQCRERSNAKEERNDRTYPEKPPLPSVNESRRKQAYPSSARKDLNSHQTVTDEH
jgi:hypothetical protein